ncbi:MAG: hypothetical protein PHO56_00295 [Patescibacteria group bacterium]|nr:hypothetical protein [Patescibacteria group bacterium]
MSAENDKNKIWLKILLGLFYAFIFVVLLYNSFAYLDPDFGWHLKMGEQIWQTHAVPDINREDYTLLGTHWVDHEWLANVFIYLIDRYFGYIVLSICFALLILAALIIQLQFIRKYFLQNDRGLFFVLILQGFGLYASLPHLGVRVQEISIFLLLLLTIIIYLYNKNKNYRILFWLIPLFLFWASVHAGFLIGLFILALFVLIKAGELWSAEKFPWQFVDYNKILNWKQIGVFAGFSFLATATTLTTPYGLRLYAFLLGYRDTYYQAHLSEWLGQYYLPFIYPQLIYIEIVLIFLPLLFFAAFIFKGEHRRKINLFDFILIIIFTGMAIKARRHFPLLFIVSLPLIAELFVNFFVHNLSFKPDKIKNFTFKKLIFILSSMGLIVAGAIIVLKINFINQPEKVYQNEYPYQAVAFLRAHPEWDDLRIFNNYGWGGYLIWQYPEKRLFIDGRLPQYQFNGHSLLEEYNDFYDITKISARLKQHKIGLVLARVKIEPVKIHWWEKAFLGINEENLLKAQQENLALADYLAISPEWQEVYNDNLAEIFIKK